MAEDGVVRVEVTAWGVQQEGNCRREGWQRPHDHNCDPQRHRPVREPADDGHGPEDDKPGPVPEQRMRHEGRGQGPIDGDEQWGSCGDPLVIHAPIVFARPRSAHCGDSLLRTRAFPCIFTFPGEIREALSACREIDHRIVHPYRPSQALDRAKVLALRCQKAVGGGTPRPNARAPGFRSYIPWGLAND